MYDPNYSIPFPSYVNDIIDRKVFARLAFLKSNNLPQTNSDSPAAKATARYRSIQEIADAKASLPDYLRQQQLQLAAAKARRKGKKDAEVEEEEESEEEKPKKKAPKRAAPKRSQKKKKPVESESDTSEEEPPPRKVSKCGGKAEEMEDEEEEEIQKKPASRSRAPKKKDQQGNSDKKKDKQGNGKKKEKQDDGDIPEKSTFAKRYKPKGKNAEKWVVVKDVYNQYIRSFVDYQTHVEERGRKENGNTKNELRYVSIGLPAYTILVNPSFFELFFFRRPT